MGPGRTLTSMNLFGYEILAAVYMKPERNVWCLVSERNDIFCLINISLTQQDTGLKFLASVQQSRRSQTGLSSFSGQSHVNEKEEMYGGRYELMPVCVRPGPT